VPVCIDSDDGGWVVGISEVESEVEEFVFIWDLVYFCPVGEDGGLCGASFSETVYFPKVLVCCFKPLNFHDHTFREERVVFVRGAEELCVFSWDDFFIYPMEFV